MTARSHETIRVGLRRLIRDKSVDPKATMEAIKLLMKVEGLMDETSHPVSPKNKPEIARTGEANGKKLRELLEVAHEKKPG
jgi:hypothetical protein